MRGPDGVFTRGVTTVRDAAAFGTFGARCVRTNPSFDFPRFTLAPGLK